MSPLLGALGDSSEYSYRGNLDDYPDDFIITNLSNVEPGIAVTTAPILVSGINNKVLVKCGSGCSVSINSGIFTSGPLLAVKNDILSFCIVTTSGSNDDFLKTYTSDISVGKRTKTWSLTTRSKDTLPDPFSFLNYGNQELGIAKTSNAITLSGLEITVPTEISITSGIGSFSKNGGPLQISSTVVNGDTISLTSLSPSTYSSTNTTTLTVGTYSTTFSVTTRPSDTTVDQFNFTNLTNVAISSSFDSNSITLSGADVDVPLTATVSGGFLKVVRGVNVVRDFSSSSATVYNGDILTLRLNSSPDYSTSTSASVSITGENTPVGVASTFTITTRPVIKDTIPNIFSFVDKTNQSRNVTVISDPIVLSGMTNNADHFADVSLVNNIDGAQFRVTRNGVVVRDFSASSTTVRNGDSIDLKITTSPASNGVVLARLDISGIDNNDINNIVSQTVTDTWNVQSAIRNCTLTAPSLTNLSGVEPSTLQSVTFTPTSYDSDCQVTVSTSNPSSYLIANGVQGNNLAVAPGVACTVFMPSGTFSETKTTTITLSSAVSLASTSTSWSVSTRAITTPTVDLQATPLTINCGDTVNLSWTSTGAVSVTTSGFTGVTTIGQVTLSSVKQNPSTYSITVTGKDGTTATASKAVTVNTTAGASLSASATDVAYNGSVTLTWNSSNSSSVVSNFGATLPSGSITLYNLKSTTTYNVRAISNNGCADSQTASVTVNVAACNPTTTTSTPTSGVTLNYTLANAGSGFDYYYTGSSGINIGNPSRQATNISGSRNWDGTGLNGGDVQTWFVPDGVTKFFCRAIGGGGGGGGSGSGQLPAGGGGGGGIAYGTVYTSPGTPYIIRYGDGGLGAPGGPSGNTPNNNGGSGYGQFGQQGAGGVLQDASGNDILRGRGGYGGGRNWLGAGGGLYDPYTNPNGVTNIANTSDGATNPGATGQFSSGGSYYGRGGNGGATGAIQSGGRGAGSRVEIQWSIQIEGATWYDLITSINSQYRSSFNKPPTNSDMNYWISQYTNYGYSTLSDLRSAISTSGESYAYGGAVDECGNSI